MGIDPEVYEDRHEWETLGYLDDIEDLDEIPDAEMDIDAVGYEARRLLEALDLDIDEDEHEIFYEDSYDDYDED
ncbi:MAG: hypothetical protein LC650_03815 [Actinobacteria bacterium]|nr:hypothetical protein [Actinomycetota bacterium]